ncbi:MAG: hypothetical protein MAG453_01640 [Calditrichaeota bacterium]|nr:hypothetical protein [Calditrichota bacterium]
MIGAYLTFIFVKGVSKVRQIGDSDDFLLAGRDVRWWLIATTMGATVIGGGYSVGAIGDAYETGLAWAFIATGGYFHFIFSGLWVAPKFRAAKLYTVAGYFGYRYDERTRFVVLILSLLFSVFIVAAQIAAIGTVLSTLMPEQQIEAISKLTEEGPEALAEGAGEAAAAAGDTSAGAGSEAAAPADTASTRTDTVIIADSGAAAAATVAGAGSADTTVAGGGQHSGRMSEAEKREAQRKAAEEESKRRQRMIQLAILIGGAMVIIYSTAGGLLAVIYTDVYQFTVLFAGFLLTLAFIAPDVVDSWGKFAEDVSDDFFRVGGGKGIWYLVTTWFAFFLGETFAPGYATRYMIGRTIRDTKIGIAGIGFLLAVTFPAVIFFIALYARNLFPGIESQQALPMVIRELHNPIIAGLMLAALLSAVMSSADSALNSATAIFVKDLFEHQLGWQHKGDRKILRLARYWTIGLGAGATAIAYLWPDIIDLLLFTYHTWAPGIIVPVVVGALSKEESRNLNRSIFYTMLFAVGVTFIYRVTPFAKEFDPAVFGVALAVVTFYTLRLVFKLKYPSESS